jgi:dihydroorotase
MNSLSIITPDDWHLHLRDTPYLEAVVADTARQFGRRDSSGARSSCPT